MNRLLPLCVLVTWYLVCAVVAPAGEPKADATWANAEYARLVFQLSKEQLDKEFMKKIDPDNLPKTEGKGPGKITDKYITATARGLAPSSLTADGKGGLKVTLHILREESKTWPGDGKALAKEPMWGSAVVLKPRAGALAYNLLLTAKPGEKGAYRGKMSGIVADGVKFHDIDFEMTPHKIR
jgi:hypothetical protein